MAQKPTYEELEQKLKELEEKSSNCEQSEGALRESEATLKSILRVAPIGIGLLHNRVFTWVSDQMCQMVGYKPDELIGKSARILYETEQEFDRVGKEKYKEIKERGTGELETRWRRKDGGVIDVLLRSTPIDPNDLSSGVTFTALDITDRILAEKALQESSKKIKLFAYSVSHDLKNPALGVYGIAKLLNKCSEDIPGKKAKKYCEQLLKTSEQIIALIDKINLYISTTESPLTIEEVYLKELIRTIEEEFSAQLSDRQITWQEPEQFPYIKVDKLAILRVIRNIVDNSLKYGGNNLSEITFDYEDSEDFHILSIRDNGVGIKTKDTKGIFGLFRRKETAKGTKGTGLGLSIVKEIAEQHGGKVWTRADSPKGITFYISISKNL